VAGRCPNHREIAFGVDHSWFLSFALLTWMLAGSYFPAEFGAIIMWSTR
jgi:hypothetical protein